MDSSYGEHTEGDQGAGLGGEKQVMGTKACARRDEPGRRGTAESLHRARETSITLCGNCNLNRNVKKLF